MSLGFMISVQSPRDSLGSPCGLPVRPCMGYGRSSAAWRSAPYPLQPLGEIVAGNLAVLTAGQHALPQHGRRAHAVAQADPQPSPCLSTKSCQQRLQPFFRASYSLCPLFSFFLKSVLTLLTKCRKPLWRKALRCQQTCQRAGNRTSTRSVKRGNRVHPWPLCRPLAPVCQQAC